MHLSRLLPFACGASVAASTILNAAEPASALAADAAASSEVVKLNRLVVAGSADETVKPAVASTRLDLAPRETPQAVTTVDRFRLDRESMFSVNDALKGVTGVHVSFYDTQRPLYFSRGFQITDFQIDGMPSYSGSTNQEYDTALYERVEVIRGANGLLTGAGTPSATVNLTRKRPDKGWAASARASVGGWNFRRGEIDVTAPVTSEGRVRSRLVLATQSTDSFRDRYTEKKLAGLASVEADLSRTTVLNVGYQYQDNDPSSPMWGVLPRFVDDGSLADLPVGTNFSTNWTDWDRTSDTIFASVDQKLGGDWTLRLAYNRTEGETYSLRVYASGYPNLTTGRGLYLLAGVGETEDVRDAIDVYVRGTFDWFGRTNDAVVGWNFNQLASDATTFASITSGTYFYRYDIPDFRSYRGEAPAPTVLRTGAHRLTNTDQSGLYGTVRLRPMARTSVLLGARLSQWSTETEVFDTQGVFTGRTGAYDVENEVTPYAGLVVDLTSSLSAYASYTDIFRPQNLKNKDNNLLAPVLGTNLEAGLKAEFLQKRLQLALGVFQTKQDNYGVRDASQPDNSLPDGSSAYIGVDGTESSGVELEISGYVLPAWLVTVGYANVNTRRHPLDLTYANVPEHLATASTHLTLPGRWNRLQVGLGGQWQGETEGYGILHPTLGRVTVTQPSFALFNVFASYRLTPHLTAQASVRNVLDKKYWATLDYPNYGEPRNLQLSVRWVY